MEAATPRTGRSAAATRPSLTRRLATETKQAFNTTEFWAMVGVIVAILVSAAVINGGDTPPGTDEFIARQAWLYVAVIVVGYNIGRGAAKSGSYDSYSEDDGDRR
jgi:hypothetical protein